MGAPAGAPGGNRASVLLGWVLGLGRVLGVVGRRLAAGPEDLGLDALQRLFQDRAQVADHVLAGGRGLRGQFPQVGGELEGQPLQVAQRPEVKRSGPAGSVVPGPAARPVFPAAPSGPVRPARSLAPPGPVTPARGVPVLLAGLEPGAGGLAKPPGRPRASSRARWASSRSRRACSCTRRAASGRLAGGSRRAPIAPAPLSPARWPAPGHAGAATRACRGYPPSPAWPARGPALWPAWPGRGPRPWPAWSARGRQRSRPGPPGGTHGPPRSAPREGCARSA